MKKVVIAGGSGFIGQALTSYLSARGFELALLSRKPKEGEFFWDPESKQIDPSIFDGAEAVINLAGENILGRWNQKKMEKIRSSRLHTTQFLCDTLLKLKTLPKVYLNASAIGYYGDRGEEILTETSQSGHGYLAELCREWENIPTQLSQKGVRVVLMRFGLVLGEDGGALKLMEKPFKMGVGGSLGKGAQIMSWIALDDVVRAIEFLLQRDDLSGPINFASPKALSNLEFTKVLARLLHKPAPMPIPKFALGMLFGSGAEVFLASAHVHPERLLSSGFQFSYPDLGECLKKYLRLNS